MSSTAIGFILIVSSVTEAIVIVLNGNHSDKTGERKWHTMITVPVGGMPYKIVILALYGIALSSWYGPDRTMPTTLIAPELLAWKVQAYLFLWLAVFLFQSF